MPLSDPIVSVPDIWPALFLAFGGVPVVLVSMVWTSGVDAYLILLATFIVVTGVAWWHGSRRGRQRCFEKMQVPINCTGRDMLWVSTESEYYLLCVALAKATGCAEVKIIVRWALVRLLFVIALVMPLAQIWFGAVLPFMEFEQRAMFWGTLFVLCFWSPWWSTLIWDRRYVLENGTLRILARNPVDLGLRCVRQIQMGRAMVTFRLDRHSIEIRDHQGALHISLLEMYRPIEFCANILKAAILDKKGAEKGTSHVVT